MAAEAAATEAVEAAEAVEAVADTLAADAAVAVAVAVAAAVAVAVAVAAVLPLKLWQLERLKKSSIGLWMEMIVRRFWVSLTSLSGSGSLSPERPAVPSLTSSVPFRFPFFLLLAPICLSPSPFHWLIDFIPRKGKCRDRIETVPTSIES